MQVIHRDDYLPKHDRDHGGESPQKLRREHRRESAEVAQQTVEVCRALSHVIQFLQLSTRIAEGQPARTRGQGHRMLTIASIGFALLSGTSHNRYPKSLHRAFCKDQRADMSPRLCIRSGIGESCTNIMVFRRAVSLIAPEH